MKIFSLPFATTIFSVHLHNQLVLGLLYNASAGIPGPSSPRSGHGHHKRDANGDLIGPNGEAVSSQSEEGDEDEPLNRVLAPPGKRLRMLTAGLSRKDRARIKSIPKNMTHSKGLASGAASSLGWAGAGADMLEKKRKEEEKRRSYEERKRVKEVHTQIGAKDWKDQILKDSAQITNVHERLSLSECGKRGSGARRCYSSHVRTLQADDGVGCCHWNSLQQHNKRLREHWRHPSALSQRNYLILTLCEI